MIGRDSGGGNFVGRSRLSPCHGRRMVEDLQSPAATQACASIPDDGDVNILAGEPGQIEGPCHKPPTGFKIGPGDGACRRTPRKADTVNHQRQDAPFSTAHSSAARPPFCTQSTFACRRISSSGRPHPATGKRKTPSPIFWATFESIPATGPHYRHRPERASINMRLLRRRKYSGHRASDGLTRSRYGRRACLRSDGPLRFPEYLKNG